MFWHKFFVLMPMCACGCGVRLHLFPRQALIWPHAAWAPYCALRDFSSPISKAQKTKRDEH